VCKVHTHCTLNTQGYKQTFRIYNTHCFSTRTVVARSRLNVTLNVHCLSCLLRMFTSRSANMDCLAGKFLSLGLLPDDRGLVGKIREGVDSSWSAMNSLFQSTKVVFGICKFHSTTNSLFYFKNHITIYIKIHINIAPTCFGLRPSSGGLH